MKKLLLTSLILIGLSFMACDRGDDSTYSGYFFQVNDIYSYAGVMEEGGYYNLDTAVTNDTIKAEDLVIMVGIRDVTYVHHDDKTNDWGSTASAEPIIPESKFAKTHTSIFSSDTVHFDSTTYAPGEDLSTEFLAATFFEGDWVVLEQFGNGLPINAEGYKEFLKLARRPKGPLNLTFTITWVFEDDSEVSSATVPLILE